MSALRADRPGALDPFFLEIKRRVIARTGHHYYDDKDDLLFERVRGRVVETGSGGFEAYLDRLGDEAADGLDDRREWAALISAITIGETYFFRYAEQFAALQAVILPALVAANRETRRLRIWSAGCASGAEPYSLAILVHDALGEALPDWRVTILGTDIDEAVLERARAAVFGRWALRSLSADEKARWFEPGPARDTVRLARRYAAMVRFETANLLDLAAGTAPLQFEDFDLILCRNVLIYFHPDMVQATVAALARSLKPDGWLLLGHAESHPAYTTGLAPVDLAGATAFRRTPDPAGGDPEALPAPAVAPPRSDRPEARPPAARPQSARPAPHPRAPVPPAPVPLVPPEGDPLPEIRALADRHELDAALVACRAARDADPARAALHFYEGAIERAAGRPAEAAFRRAIYLDRRFVLAHYHLGLALRDLGQPEWLRAVAAAARLAAQLPQDAAVPEGDGVSAAEMARMARFLLERGR